MNMKHYLKSPDFLPHPESPRQYLYSVLATIHIVSEEKKICWHQQWSHSPKSFLKTYKIVKIPMKIAWQTI